MISGSPLSSTPISADLTPASSGGNQTFTTAVVSTWTVPAPTLVASGAATFTTAVSSTWTVPAPTLVNAGSIALPTAVSTWTVPTPTLVAQGTASFTTSVTGWQWVVPTPAFTGGIQGHGNILELFELLGEEMPSFNKEFAITPSDTANFPWFQGQQGDKPFPCKAIYVGGAGDVVTVDADGTAIMHAGATAGSYLVGAWVRVNSTSTTATNLVAEFSV